RQLARERCWQQVRGVGQHLAELDKNAPGGLQGIPQRPACRLLRAPASPARASGRRRAMADREPHQLPIPAVPGQKVPSRTPRAARRPEAGRLGAEFHVRGGPEQAQHRDHRHRGERRRTREERTRGGALPPPNHPRLPPRAPPPPPAGAPSNAVASRTRTASTREATARAAPIKTTDHTTWNVTLTAGLPRGPPRSRRALTPRQVPPAVPSRAAPPTARPP